MRSPAPPEKAAGHPALHETVASRFGLVPNFFRSADAAPEIIEKMWDFCCAAYLDNPLPSLFKERLFVYLSRFCDVRYCILRHCAFLLGYGHAAGDPGAPAQSVEQAVALLMLPTPWQLDLDQVWCDLDSLEGMPAWPQPGSAAEFCVIAAATLLFVEPGRGERARESLRRALGARTFEHLMGLLTFIRAVHTWTKLHPGIEREDDVDEMLRLSDKLRRLLLEDPEACRCEMGAQLFAELEDLRDLRERHELEKANRELARRAEQLETLRGEIHHRVKNSLQIVSSVLHMQLPRVTDPVAAEILRSSETRVRAIAAVHERLYRDEGVQSIAFDRYLRSLCEDVAHAYGRPGGIAVETVPVVVNRDQAVSIALIVNELVTNAFRHATPPCRVRLHDVTERGFRLTVSDSGNGPSGEQQAGFGTSIIAGLSRQLGATVERCTDATGYRCTLFVPCEMGSIQTDTPSVAGPPGSGHPALSGLSVFDSSGPPPA